MPPPPPYAEAAATVAVADASPPPEYLCPITGGLLSDPVVCSDGHTYERVAFEAWIAEHPPPGTCSPVTNEPLRSTDAYPNIALRRLAQAHRSSRAGQQRPSE